MAAFADILLRADAILEKYSHYDEMNQKSGRKSAQRSEDPFSDKYFDIMDRVQEINLVSVFVCALQPTSYVGMCARVVGKHHTVLSSLHHDPHPAPFLTSLFIYQDSSRPSGSFAVNICVQKIIINMIT